MANTKIPVPKELLEDLYWNKQLSIKEIALELGVSSSVIFDRMNEYGIRRRTHSEIKVGFERRKKISLANSGVNNPFFGKKHTLKTRHLMSLNHPDMRGEKNPFFGHKHNIETRRKIAQSHLKNGIGVYRRWAIEAYGKCCEICGVDYPIVVHHIDGNRENNAIDNLMVLCNKCHLCMEHPLFIHFILSLPLILKPIPPNQPPT